MIAFQGSESSTSDGILKVFDKAQKYKESNKVLRLCGEKTFLLILFLQDVIPVVLLDEVGLAEISKYTFLLSIYFFFLPQPSGGS